MIAVECYNCNHDENIYKCTSIQTIILDQKGAALVSPWTNILIGKSKKGEIMEMVGSVVLIF